MVKKILKPEMMDIYILEKNQWCCMVNASKGGVCWAWLQSFNIRRPNDPKVDDWNLTTGDHMIIQWSLFCLNPVMTWAIARKQRLMEIHFSFVSSQHFLDFQPFWSEAIATDVVLRSAAWVNQLLWHFSIKLGMWEESLWHRLRHTNPITKTLQAIPVSVRPMDVAQVGARRC